MISQDCPQANLMGWGIFSINIPFLQLTPLISHWQNRNQEHPLKGPLPHMWELPPPLHESLRTPTFSNVTLAAEYQHRNFGGGDFWTKHISYAMWEHSFHPIPPFLPCKATVRSFPDIEPAGGLHDKTTSSITLPFGRNVWALPCASLCQSSWPILFYSGTEKSQFSGSFPCIPCLQLQCFPLTSEE